jgi:AhpD family alkylhydroperoxidase
MPKKTPWYLEHARDVGNAYVHFRNAVHEKSALDEKTRELIQLACACLLRCPHCTEEHLKGALKAGADKREVTETLLLAAYEGAGTQLAWKKELYEKLLGETEE